MYVTELTAQCLAEMSSRGPRYTSYPPATEFAPIAGATVARQLAAVARRRDPVALYVHVPFCRSLCAYCGCNVIPTRDRSRGDAYVDTVATELALLAHQLGEAFPIAEIALGGGSPNFLEPAALRRLVGSIEHAFAVDRGARRSVELDPRSTTSSQLDAFAGLGFHAFSAGVQDFDERVQDAIRRHQSVAQTRWLVERARAAGFTDVNLDIVYGLPHQTEETFAATLDAIVSLAPDRIALFGYAHLPDKLPHQRLVERAGRVLDRYERATLLLLAIDRLTAAGYVHLGLDHFARPGSPLARAANERRMVRTFQGYVERRADTILGAGTSAISSTPGAMWQNHAELAPWRDAIADGRLPVERGVVLDADDQIRSALINRLMCDGEVDLAALGRDLGIDPDAYFAAELADLAGLDQLAHYDRASRVVTTTAVGRLLVRNVCMAFDRYHRGAAAAQRFSSTI
jgi:oxygen-independent coproporphyrinogen-3 oxidase